MVAGEDVDGRGHGANELLDQRVLVVGPVVDQVAGDEQGVGAIGQSPHGVEYRGQPRHRVGGSPVAADVGVADLGDEERGGHAPEAIALPIAIENLTVLD